MNRKSAYIAFLILGLLVSAVVTVGVRISMNEERVLRMEYEELLRQDALVLSDSSKQFILAYRVKLDPLLDNAPNNPIQARDYLRRNPFVDNFFMLDLNGRLLVPSNQAEDLSDRERRFLDRTKEIWEDKRLLNLGKPEIQFSSKLTSSSPSDSFWYPYYWNDGFHVLLVKRDTKGIRGFELNSARITAELLNALSSSFENSERQAVLVVRDVMGRVIFQSKGEWSSENMGMVVESALPEPFASWKVSAIGVQGYKAGRSALFNMISATTLLASAISLLGLFYVRIQRQEIADASKRVNFVNQVSHELRTPLTNIRMYAELLEQEIEDEESNAARHLRIIISESHRLSRLIGNVLTFSGKDKSNLRLNLRRLSLKSVLLEILEHFQPILRDKGIITQYSINEEGEVFADRDCFQQIVSNLISNVEKYGNAGKFLGIDLSIRGDEARLIVSDRGPGIPPDERRYVFNEFYRISNKLTDGVTGAGIGLSIVRKLAELHGGSVDVVDSKEGAVFDVRLHTPRIVERTQS